MTPSPAAQAEPQTTTERIEQAALELFSLRGYHGATTRDIAQHAGLSPAGVYVHFASKEELLLSIVRRGHQRAFDAFERGLANGQTPTERIQGAVAAFTAWHASEQQLARVTQYELDSLTPPGQAEIRALRTTFERKLRREIATGVASGEFQVDDIPTTATAIFSLCIDVARWHKPSHRNIAKLATLYGRLSTQMLQGPRA